MKAPKILATVSSIASGLFLTSGAYAADCDPKDPLCFVGGVTTSGQELMPLATSLINWAVGLAALVCVVILIASGYKYITAAGDEAKVESATKTLTFAIIGLVVCFIAVILVKFVLSKIITQ